MSDVSMDDFLIEKHEAIEVLEKFRETGIYENAFELINALDMAIKSLKSKDYADGYDAGYECGYSVGYDKGHAFGRIEYK